MADIGGAHPQKLASTIYLPLAIPAFWTKRDVAFDNSTDETTACVGMSASGDLARLTSDRQITAVGGATKAPLISGKTAYRYAITLRIVWWDVLAVLFRATSEPARF